MTESQNLFKRPKIRNRHYALTIVERMMKDFYRKGKLVRPKKNKKRRKVMDERE